MPGKSKKSKTKNIKAVTETPQSAPSAVAASRATEAALTLTALRDNPGITAELLQRTGHAALVGEYVVAWATQLFEKKTGTTQGIESLGTELKACRDANDRQNELLVEYELLFREQERENEDSRRELMDLREEYEDLQDAYREEEMEPAASVPGRAESGNGDVVDAFSRSALEGAASPAMRSTRELDKAELAALALPLSALAQQLGGTSALSEADGAEIEEEEAASDEECVEMVDVLHHASPDQLLAAAWVRQRDDGEVAAAMAINGLGRILYGSREFIRTMLEAEAAAKRGLAGGLE